MNKSYFLVVLFFPLLATAWEAAPTSLLPSGPEPETDPEFSWEPLPQAVQYRINVRNAANRPVFNGWFTAREAACADEGSLCRVRTGSEFAGASYRWRVIAKDAQQQKSNWSEWQVFFPGQDSAPNPPLSPTTVAPENTVQSNQPEFSWRPVEQGTRYRLKVVDDRNRRVLNRWRTAAALGCSDGISDCRLPSPTLFEAGQYRWKVLARNSLTGQNSDWSDWVSFEVPTPAQLGSGLDSRPQNLSCSLPESPARVSEVAAERVYAQLPVSKAVAMVSSPLTASAQQRWFVLEQDGEIIAFDPADPGPAASEVFLDIRDRALNDTGETGLLGLAFHPEFPDENRAFVFYTNRVNGQYESYLSEFLSRDGGQTLDPDSERNILTITGHASHNHKAGTVGFGPDGYLYLSLGDGGSPQESQNPFSLFGSLVRIDVDNGDPYAIPPDNPFADGVDGAPEVYAYGFRNPWRWSFDPQGFIWLTDVGLSSWEEINIVSPGANYGWPILEGPDCRLQEDCDSEGLTPPLFAYPHDETGGFVVVGGFVYRGQAFPELQGKFVFADGSDRVWALFYDEVGEPESELLVDGGLVGSIIHSMFEGEDGELYLVKAGPIYRLEPSENPAPPDFPQLLSETGCVDPLDPTQVVEGAIPYGINTPFWTDGADKSRWMALPPDGTIETGEDGDLHFPIGTVFIKEFSLNGRRIETRLLARHDDGEWGGYTYVWNESETEAELLDPAGRDIDIDGQNYTLPSRQQCLFCHSEAAGRSLGLQIQQQNAEFVYPSTGRSANQLKTWELIGLFNQPLPAHPDDLPAFPSIHDHSVSFSERARAYLHSNCSSCHRPGGPGRGPADFRFQPLATMNICDVEPEVWDLGIENAKLLAPGDPARSVIAIRAGSTEGGIAMPPIGKNRVDIDAVAVIEEYIASLESCPPAD